MQLLTNEQAHEAIAIHTLRKMDPSTAFFSLSGMILRVVVVNSDGVVHIRFEYNCIL